MTPESCFANLVGVKSLCAESDPVPILYLDDVEGIDIIKLAQVANETSESGKKFAQDIIDSAIRLFLSDIEGLFPVNYSLNRQLGNSCSTATFSGFYVTGSQYGSIIQLTGLSKYSLLKITKMDIQVGDSGTYDFVVDDGTTQQTFSTGPLTGGVRATVPVNFSTTASQVKIYFTDPNVRVSQLTQPSSGCGCSGGNGVLNSNDLTKNLLFSGLQNGVIQSVQYGFVPCLEITCSWDSLICNLITAAPKLIALTLLYKVAHKYFLSSDLGTRNNRVVGYDKDEKVAMASKFDGLYRKYLNSEGVTGVRQLINQQLQYSRDICILCDSPFKVRWAV